jgi:hypothetical protein
MKIKKFDDYSKKRLEPKEISEIEHQAETEKNELLILAMKKEMAFKNMNDVIYLPYEEFVNSPQFKEYKKINEEINSYRNSSPLPDSRCSSESQTKSSSQTSHQESLRPQVPSDSSDTEI